MAGVRSKKDVIEGWYNEPYYKHHHYDQELKLTVQAFLRILDVSATEQNWLTDEQITIPIILLAAVRERSDILIIPPSAASVLCSIGLDRADTNLFEEFHPKISAELRTGSGQWIVIPCSDGMIDAVEWSPSKAVGGEKKEGPFEGSHWGFMVIDKSRTDARWFDSSLKLKPKKSKPKKLRINHMFRAGSAAGIVLRGFERVVGGEPGKIIARTLKYVPHAVKDNKCKDDGDSACGPYIHAMLHYLIDNSGYLENISKTFVRRRWKHHRRKMDFDSLATRKKMHEIVRQHVEGEAPADAPYRISAAVVKALNIPILDILRKSLETFHGPSAAPALTSRPRAVPSTSGLTSTGGTYKGVSFSVLQETLGEKEKLNDSNRDHAYELYITTKKSTMDSRHTWGLHSKQGALKYPEGFDNHKDNLPDFARISKAEIAKWIKVHKDDQFKPATGVTLGDGMKRSILYSTYKRETFSKESEETLKIYHQADRNAFTKAERKDVDNWGKKAIEDRLDATYLNLDVPLFAPLIIPRIDAWAERLYPEAHALLTGTTSELLYHRARGLLHRMFVGELDDMSAEDIAEWRANDPSIMAKYRKSNEAAMIIMKILYEGKDVESVPFLKHSPLHWPDRKERVLEGEKRKRDSDGDDGDEGGSAPKKSKTNPSDPTSTAEFEEIPDEDPPASGGVETTTDPKEIDWLTITDVDLKAYVTEEVKRDRRIGSNPNNYTYRAILLIQHRGSFRNGSQKGRENTWVYDTNVFSHGLTSSKRKLDVELQDDKSAKEKYMHLTIHPSPVEILKRLADTYEPEEAAPEEAAPPDEAAPPGKPASGDPGPKKPEPKEPASSKPAPGKKALGEPAPGKPVPGKSASSAAVSKTTVSNSTVSKTIVSNSTVSKTIVSNSTVSKITVSKTTASKTAASKGKVTKATKKGKTKKTSPKEKAKKAAALETAVSETAASETAVTKAPEKLPPADRTIEKLSLPELRRHVPNFTKVQGKFLDAWRKFNFPGPDPYAPMPKNPKAWEARKLLQRIYGGFGQLNDKDLTYWGNNEDSLKKLKAEHNGDPALIRKMLEDQTAEYAGIDLRGQKAFYSDIYLKTRVRFVDPDFVFDDELVDKEGGDKNTTDDAVADENISDDEDTPDNHATGAPTPNDAEGDEDNTPRDAEHDSTRGGSPATHESAQPDAIFISSEPPTDLESDEGATDANDQTWNGDD
jgi:hypothetical protein